MKNTRILIALALILVVVVVAQGGVGAWANKLRAGSKASVAAPVEAGARLVGTGTGDPTVPVPTSGDCAVLATYCVTSKQDGLKAQAITELPNTITIPEGKKVIVTRMIEITSGTGVLVTTKDVLFTLDPALTTDETVAYWDGTQWVELTADNGQYTIPLGATLPLYVTVFTKAN